MAADISERIRAIYSTLSKGQKKIANAVLNDYDKVAYLTAAKLGTKTVYDGMIQTVVLSHCVREDDILPYVRSTLTLP